MTAKLEPGPVRTGLKSLASGGRAVLRLLRVVVSKPKAWLGVRKLAVWFSLIATLPYGRGQDRITKIGAIEVDGVLREWGGIPCRIFGAGEAVEQLGTLSLRQGWNEAGLYFAMSCNDHRINPAGPPPIESIDLFIDTRKRTARMDKYEDGVQRFTVRMCKLSGDEAAPEFLTCESKGIVVKAAYNKQARCVTMEGAIWRSAVPMLKLAEQQEFSWSIRVNFGDAWGSYSLGATSIESKNTLEGSPIAFTPVVCASADLPSVPWDIRAQEVSFQGDVCVDVRVVRPTNREKGKGDVTIRIPELNFTERALWTPSLSGDYQLIHIRRSLSPQDVVALSGVLKVEMQGATWSWASNVSMRAALIRKRAELRIPEASMANLGAEERAMANLLKQCAFEAAALSCKDLNMPRAPGKEHRSSLDDSLYVAEAELFIKAAERLLHGAKIDMKFPYRAWQSSFDNAWLPIKVVYPINYDSKKRYGAKLLIYGLDADRTRSRFMEDDLIAFDQGRYNAFQGDYFSVVLYGRGNSFDTLGNEEFDYVVDRLLPSLGVDMTRVGMYGGSFGAATAVEVALQHPDKISWVHSRGGSFDSLISRLKACQGANPIANLAGRGLFLEVGERDRENLDGNTRFARLAKDAGCEVEHVIRAGAPHSFGPTQPQDTIRGKALPLPWQDWRVVIEEPKSPAVFWLARCFPLRAGETMQLSGRVDGDAIRIETRNVRYFEFDERAFIAVITGKRLFLDGKEVPLGPASDDLRWFELDGREWGQIPKGIVLKIGGSMSDVEFGPLTIIYGTRDPARTYWLKERADQIVQARVGVQPGQWGGRHIAIRTDAECEGMDLNKGRFWLVGGTQENSIAAKLRENMPFTMTGTRIICGNRVIDAEDCLGSALLSQASDGSGDILLEAGTSNVAYCAPILTNGEMEASVIRMKRSIEIAQWLQSDVKMPSKE